MPDVEDAMQAFHFQDVELPETKEQREHPRRS